MLFDVKPREAWALSQPAGACDTDVQIFGHAPSLPLNHSQLTRKERFRIAFWCPTFHPP